MIVTDYVTLCLLLKNQYDSLNDKHSLDLLMYVFTDFKVLAFDLENNQTPRPS